MAEIQVNPDEPPVQVTPLPHRSASQRNKEQREANKTPSTATKMELFIQLCQTGVSIPSALKGSGLLEDIDKSTYIPGIDDELSTEELFYDRVRAPKSQCQILTDQEYRDLQPDEQATSSKNGILSTSQLYKLVDWLYFVRGLPLGAIANALKIEKHVIGQVKAVISNDFAKAIRSQSAEGYIGDLLRIKELLRADIMLRKKGSISEQSHIQYDRLLWELEHDFIERLQDIGLINKTIGRMDVHEEWHVTIQETTGLPLNRKVEQLGDGTVQSTNNGDGGFIDVDAIIKAEESDNQVTASAPTPDLDGTTTIRGSHPVQQGRSAATKPTRVRKERKHISNSPTINVGND